MKPIIQYSKAFGHLSIIGEFTTGSNGDDRINRIGVIFLTSEDVGRIRNEIGGKENGNKATD